jgi:hypothetical protein
VEAPDGLSDVSPNSSIEKHVVQTFGSEMIRAFCEDTGLRYATDEDGDVVIAFGYGQARDCGLKVYVYASGRSNSILCVRIVSDKRYRPEHEPALLEAINRFHCDRRWPKVYSRMTERTVSLICEAQLDLAMGAHQAFVNDFIDTAISSANAFWRYMRGVSIPNVQDEWLIETSRPEARPDSLDTEEASE